MIQIESILKVADNSGAKTVKCIKILNRSKSKFAYVGDCILVSVRSVRPRSGCGASLQRRQPDLANKSSIKKGQIFKALVIRTKKSICNRKYGHSLSFGQNDVVLINEGASLIGSRIFGPITRELRAKNYRKIISQSKRML